MTAPVSTLVGSLALIGAMLTGCADAPVQTGPAPGDAAVLIVGIDGLEWDVVLPLMREGRMPHLESLMARGSFGTLETYAPAKSPVIWTTIATGKAPDKHGIVDFTWNDDDGVRHLFSSGDRRTKALWNILSDVGQRSIFVGWWNTYPAETIDGVVVSQANTLEQISTRRLLKPGGMLPGESRQVHPPSRMDEIWGIVAGVDFELPQLREEIFGTAARPRWAGDRANLEACMWSIRADESMRRVVLKLLAEGPLPAVTGVYFGLPDVVGHRFWRFHEPEAFEYPPPAEAIEAFGQVVRDSYVRADSIVGQLVAAVGLSTNVLVVSDHGMHADNRSSRFDVPVHGRLERESGGHEDGPAGLFVAAGPNIRRMRTPGPVADIQRGDLPRVGHVVDVAPTVLALRGVALGRDMDGGVLDTVLDEAFNRGFEPSYVETHDTAAWLAARDTHVMETPGTAERLEQLRSLGYIGDSSRPAAVSAESPVAVYLVRHAEKAKNDPRDPDLSRTGLLRARALAELLSSKGVTHLFSTEYKRTRQTLQPLSEAAGTEITVIPAGDDAAWLSELRSLAPGSTAVVAGHSNTIPGMVCDLAGPVPGLDCEARRLPDDQYDRLFLVVLPPAGAPPRATALKY